MARKGQGIEIVEGWQDGLGGEDFLRGLVQRTVQQVLEAEMTSFLGAGSYERTGDRRGWRNGYKAADAEDAGGRAGVDGSEGPRRGVSDRAVRALPAQREGPGSGDVADVCGGRVDAQGKRDHRGSVRSGGEQEPGIGVDAEAGCGDRRVAGSAARSGVSVPGHRRSV